MPVYFFGCDEGYVKIGQAKNVVQRLAQTNTYCPFEMRILAVLPGSQYEGYYLNEFRAQHVRGEWFRFEGKLKDFVENHHLELDGEDFADESAVKALQKALNSYIAAADITAHDFAKEHHMNPWDVRAVCRGEHTRKISAMRKISEIVGHSFEEAA